MKTIITLLVATTLFTSTVNAADAPVVAKPSIVLRCVVDVDPSDRKFIPPADIVLSADATLPVPAIDHKAGLPDAPADDVANVSVSPSVKQGNGPAEVSIANLEKPHNSLTGTDLTVWNQFCEGRSPKEVGEWRYNRCSALDPAFKR